MHSRRVVAAVQARMGSERLPGKVLMDLRGKTVLEHVVERLMCCRRLDLVTVATSVRPENDEICKVAARCGVGCFRGPEQDCLERFLGVGRASGAEILVRVTADCPLVDPELTDRLVEELIARDLDYVVGGSDLPRGLTSEVMTASALERAGRSARKAYEREHVTIHMYENPHLFRVGRLDTPAELSRPRYRLTLDTRDDLRLIGSIYAKLYVPGRIVEVRDAIRHLDLHPELVELNAHVVQKDPHGEQMHAA